MATCVIPQNQPIYQALLEKAASYPSEKVFQIAAYNKAAQNVLVSNYTLYKDFRSYIPGVGVSIQMFIENFIKSQVSTSNALNADRKTFMDKVNDNPVNHFDHSWNNHYSRWSTNTSMEDARKAAAANAPKDFTSWPNDEAARAAFQDKLVSSQEIVQISITDVLKNKQDKLERQNIRANQREKRREARESPSQNNDSQQTIECDIRYSKRLLTKPKIQYHDGSDDFQELDDDETYIDDDDIDEEDCDEHKKVILAIKDVCDKKGWKFSDELIAEYDAWRSTATEDYKIKQYRHLQGHVGYMTEVAIAKRWATQFSDYLWKQKLRMEIAHGLRKYCDKHKITYEDGMIYTYIAWYNNPSIPNWVKTSCIRPSYANPIREWFSTLNKVIVW